MKRCSQTANSCRITTLWIPFRPTGVIFRPPATSKLLKSLHTTSLNQNFLQSNPKVSGKKSPNIGERATNSRKWQQVADFRRTFRPTGDITGPETTTVRIFTLYNIIMSQSRPHLIYWISRKIDPTLGKKFPSSELSVDFPASHGRIRPPSYPKTTLLQTINRSGQS